MLCRKTVSGFPKRVLGNLNRHYSRNFGLVMITWVRDTEGEKMCYLGHSYFGSPTGHPRLAYSMQDAVMTEQISALVVEVKKMYKRQTYWSNS